MRPTAFFDDIRLKNPDGSQMLRSFRGAIACLAANKNHQGNPCPPGRHCQTGPMNQPDVQSRRGSEEPSPAASAQETVIRLDWCFPLAADKGFQIAECAHPGVGEEAALGY
jgi:hypothetical protein